ncbi:MAG TPA: magnesium/cobalt transporter CorA [Dehalococcoidia bacterium]|nr:magnesium/cobalt transporter CorA [Dehalococcoidia bacterium]
MRSVYLDGEIIRLDPSNEDVRDAIASKTGVLWVDLAPGDDPQPVLERLFAFHPLAIEDAINSRVETPKVDDYGNYLFIVAQSVAYGGIGERLDIAEVDVFLGPNYVVTTRKRTVGAIDELFNRACENQHILIRGADFLTHTILDSLVDLILPAVEEMDETIDALEQRILERPDKALLPEVLLLKRNTLRLRRSILPQRDMVNRLSRGEFGQLIGSDALIFYRDVYDHIVRVEEMLEGLRDLADSALNTYLSATNNRMNEVMKAMSVVAVIFLPLTLIASIYGTNLDLSPLGVEFKHGFLLMLGSMVAISAVSIYLFHKRGWF